MKKATTKNLNHLLGTDAKSAKCGIIKDFESETEMGLEFSLNNCKSSKMLCTFLSSICLSIKWGYEYEMP